MCYSPWFEWVFTPLDWILMHPESAQSFFQVWLFLPQTTNGYCRFPRHYTSKYVQADASLSVHENLFGWSLMNHQGKPGWPFRSLEISLYQVARSGLENQCPQVKLCATATEYLDFILTRTGIKPQPKKVQAILAITLPRQVKELCRFLGMVRYYHDFWARCSEMLVPLISLVGECGHTKVTRSKKTKK